MWLIGAIVVADINALYSGMCTRPANMSRVWHAKSRAPRPCRVPASQLYWKRAACVRQPWCGSRGGARSSLRWVWQVLAVAPHDCGSSCVAP